jgi:general secretion pathway protein M
VSEWLAGLEQRERIVLIGGAIVTVLLVLFVFVLRPLNLRTAFLMEKVTAQQSLRIDLARAAGIGGSVARGPAPTDSSLYGLARSVADQHAVALGVIRQDGPDTVRIQFTDVPFDALAAWLVALSNQHAIRVEQLSANRRERGIVTGQVVLRRP